jgi:hypothetical protein
MMKRSARLLPGHPVMSSAGGQAERQPLGRLTGRLPDV